MMLQPKSFEEPNSFFCRGYDKRQSVLDCIAWYVDANALNQKDKPCFKCTQGTEVRGGFSKS